MYQQTKLNIIYGENLYVDDNAYIQSQPEYICLGNVNDVDIIR